MKIIIGADLVPTESNYELFSNKLSPLSRHKFQIYHDTSYFEFSKRNGA
jgi:hypothetical protein